MDGIKKNLFKYSITLLTGILLGIVLGAASMSTLISYRIEEYHERITYLETTIEDRDARLKKLEESINDRRFILKEIEVELLGDGDEMDKITLEKHIKEKYTSMVGREVKSIDLEMTEKITDQRIMQIGDKEFKLIVVKSMLTETLKLWVDVKELE